MMKRLGVLAIAVGVILAFGIIDVAGAVKLSVVPGAAAGAGPTATITGGPPNGSYLLVCSPDCPDVTCPAASIDCAVAEYYLARALTMSGMTPHTVGSLDALGEASIGPIVVPPGCVCWQAVVGQARLDINPLWLSNGIGCPDAIVNIDIPGMVPPQMVDANPSYAEVSAPAGQALGGRVSWRVATLLALPGRTVEVRFPAAASPFAPVEAFGPVNVAFGARLLSGPVTVPARANPYPYTITLKQGAKVLAVAQGEILVR